MKNKSKSRRRPEGRRKVDVSCETSTPKRAKPVSVRSRSGLTHPIRGTLGRALAEELS
jgi:hypothetical protein